MTWKETPKREGADCVGLWKQDQLERSEKACKEARAEVRHLNEKYAHEQAETRAKIQMLEKDFRAVRGALQRCTNI